jgi:hypothetical protein
MITPICFAEKASGKIQHVSVIFFLNQQTKKFSEPDKKPHILKNPTDNIFNSERLTVFPLRLGVR